MSKKWKSGKVTWPWSDIRNSRPAFIEMGFILIRVNLQKWHAILLLIKMNLTANVPKSLFINAFDLSRIICDHKTDSKAPSVAIGFMVCRSLCCKLEAFLGQTVQNFHTPQHVNVAKSVAAICLKNMQLLRYSLRMQIAAPGLYLACTVCLNSLRHMHSLLGYLRKLHHNLDQLLR